jgi:hypothetical protein
MRNPPWSGPRSIFSISAPGRPWTRRFSAALRDDLGRGIHTLPIWMQSIVRELLDATSLAGRRFRRSRRSKTPDATKASSVKGTSRS